MRRTLIILICFLLLTMVTAPRQLVSAGLALGFPAMDNLYSLPLKTGIERLVRNFTAITEPGNNTGVNSPTSPGVYFNLDGGWGPYQGNAIIQFDGSEYAYNPAMGGVLIYCSTGIYPYVIIPADESKAICRGTVTVAGNNPVPIKIEIADAHRIDIFVNNQDMNALKDATVSFAGVTIYTNENGLASFDRYPLGTYTYSVSNPGYISIENQSFEVMAQVETITVTLNRIVYDATFNVISGNSPLEGAGVNLHGIEKMTDAHGTATFRNLAESTYDYLVTKAGYFEENGSIVIADGNVYREINLISITRITEAESINAGIYPNPGNGYFLVCLPGNCIGKITITLTDIRGTLLFKSNIDGTVSRFKLDATGLGNGIYLLTASGKNFKQMYKLIKQ